MRDNKKFGDESSISGKCRNNPSNTKIDTDYDISPSIYLNIQHWKTAQCRPRTMESLQPATIQ